MTRPRRTPKRWPSKEAREIAAAVHALGGHIELTSKNRLKITGPAGHAVVSATPCGSGAGGNTLGNTYACIRRETGLTLTPANANAGRRPKPRAHTAPRHGTVTRWRTGETYGFITDDTGRPWFVSRHQLTPALADLMHYGARVTFTGRPEPADGKPYPEPTRIRVTP
jgi:cold shock CspA family protein